MPKVETRCDWVFWAAPVGFKIRHQCTQPSVLETSCFPLRFASLGASPVLLRPSVGLQASPSLPPALAETSSASKVARPVNILRVKVVLFRQCIHNILRILCLFYNSSKVANY